MEEKKYNVVETSSTTFKTDTSTPSLLFGYTYRSVAFDDAVEPPEAGHIPDHGPTVCRPKARSSCSRRLLASREPMSHHLES